MDEPSAQAVPRVFISYSWSTPEHQNWVVELAERLANDGVHVVIDVWDVKEGHDVHAFMEKMVTDPLITRVLMIIDKKYTEKANARKGGVGTESQIISAELYTQVEQRKFVPILKERDEGGHAVLSVYLSNRVYLDFSNAANFLTEYEKLLRNIFDKPARQRPMLGKSPEFLTADSHPATPVRFRLEAFLVACERGTPEAVGHLRRFFEECIDALEAFRINGSSSEEPLDEKVMTSIRDMKPLRDLILKAIDGVATFTDDTRHYQEIHRFLESAARFLFRPSSLTSWNERWFDNYRFFCWELFIYLIALLIHHQRYERVQYFTRATYHHDSDENDGVSAYTIFGGHIGSLDHMRNQRLELRRISVTADILKERADFRKINFEELMQADVVLTLQQVLLDIPTLGRSWFPRSAVYLERSSRPLRIFSGIPNGMRVDHLKPLFGIDGAQDLLVKMKAAYEKHNLGQWRFEIWPIPFFTMMGLEKYAQRHNLR